jgi:membrane protease YdiL (CAAX protease family)
MSEAIPAEVVDEEPEPWGLWATLGFALIVLVAFVVIQTAILTTMVVAEQLRDRSIDVEQTALDLGSNGLFVSLATFASALPCLGLTVLFAWARRQLPVRQYLALRRVPRHVLLRWLLLFTVFLLGIETINYGLDRPVPEFMLEVYRTAGSAALLWVALIVVAPLFEEFFFRGFVFRGIQHSRLGSAGATLITAAVWAGIHLQYDACDVLFVFAAGVVLGIARVRSGSLVPPLVLHATMNLVATIQVMLCVAA